MMTESTQSEPRVELPTSTSTSTLTKPTRRRGRWTWALLAAPFVVALGLGAVVRAQPFEGPEMMGGGEHGPGMRHHVEQMLTAIGASDAQKSQIKTIWEGARPQLKTLPEQHQQVRTQIREALGAPTIDAARIEQLRKQSVQTMDKLSSVMTQAFVASANVLTPDQRKLALAKFQERTDERRQERQEHRGGHHGEHGGPPPQGAPAAGAQ
jgi:protein CpxP